MDSQFPQQTSQTNIPKTIFIFIGILVILVLDFILGFALRPIIRPQKLTPPLPNKPSIDVSKLPISLSLLYNPIVYEWRGSVQGKMIKKDEHTFTLVNDQGNTIAISNITADGEKWKTVFYDKDREASYSAIPVGTILRGDFFVFKNGPNTPVGSVFFKQ